MKFKSAYIDYLRGDYTIFDLQKIAQADIEALDLQSEALFHFAYVLEDDFNAHNAIIKDLEKIKSEFGLIQNLDEIREEDIKHYFDNKIAEMCVTDHFLLQRFFELRDFYHFLEEKSENKLEKFLPGFQETQVEFENILQIFNRFYPNCSFNDELLTTLYRLYIDDYQGEAEEEALLELAKKYFQDFENLQ